MTFREVLLAECSVTPLVAMPDVVGLVGCLSQDAGRRIDLSNDRCFAVPGSRCLLRHLLRV